MSIGELLKSPEPPAPGQKPAEALDPQAKLRKQALLGFVAIVAVGLALAGTYVGWRVFSGRAAKRASVAAAVNVAPARQEVTKPAVVPAATSAASAAVAEPAKSAPVKKTVQAAEPAKPKGSPVHPVQFVRRDVKPRPGETYLQVAAFGPRALQRYLENLDAQGLHPLVAPGPSENIFRILIGPYRDSAALEQARNSMRASGIEPILRSY